MAERSRSGVVLDPQARPAGATNTSAGGPPRFFALLALPSGAVVAGTCGRGTSRSDDGARSWSPSPLPVHAAVNALAIDRAGDVLAATSEGLLRSTDDGGHWRPAALAGCPLFAVTTVGTEVVVGAQDGGLLRSADGGATWHPSPRLSPHAVYRLARLPGGDVLAGTEEAGVWRIGADGEARPAGLSGSSVFALAPLDDRRWLAGTREAGVHRSEDGGATWLPSSTGLPDDMVQVLIIGEGGAVFAGTGRGVARSDDSGRTWSPLGVELAHHRIFSLALTPEGLLLAGSYEGVWAGDPQHGGWAPVDTGLSADDAFAVVVDVGGVAYAGTRGGARRSTDGGATWHAAGLEATTYALATLASGAVLAGTDDGVQERDGASDRWRPAGLPGQRVYCFAEVAPGHVLAGTLGAGVWCRAGAGERWIEASHGLGDPMAFDLARTREGDVLLASGAVRDGVKAGGIQRSSDGGRHWCPTRVEPITVYRIVERSDGVLFAGAQGARILRSVDGGTSWHDRPTGLVGLKLFCLAIDDADVLYLGAGSLLLRSTDGAEHWEVVGDGLEGATVFAVAPHPGGRLLAATSYGLYRSDDRGTTWDPGEVAP
jgi:ligand-binding sensor domain-containing protein